MASVRTRDHRDGSTTYLVTWREGGEQRGYTVRSSLQAARRLAKRIEALGRLPADLDTESDDIPDLATWGAAYLDTLTRVSDRTRADYARQARQHIYPHLGDLPLDAITRQGVMRWVNELGRSRAPKTVKDIHGLLSAMLTEAERQGHVTRNVARGIDMPRPPAGDPMVIMRPDQYRAIAAQLSESWRPLADLLVGTGLRYSEATALQVGDIDLTVPCLFVRRAWNRAPDGWVAGPPKTERSRRTVLLAAHNADDLAALIHGKPASALVFTGPGGGRAQHGSFYKAWVAACRRSGTGLAPRVHDLRHTHVTWLLAAGEDMYRVQQRVGHEKVTTTIDRYGHADTAWQATAAHMMDSLIGGSPRSAVLVAPTRRPA